MAEIGMLVDAIIGRGFKSIAHAEEMTRLELAYFSGDQHNPEWKWEREILKTLPYWHLEVIYNYVGPE